MNYWLVKSEPDIYSIDQLKRDRKTHWHGVRNYQARNYLQAMKSGDKVLFYHSNCEPTGIVGVATVCREAYPDPSQFDRNDEYFDPKASKDKPRWFCPDIQYTARYPRMVTLDRLKEAKGLADFPLVKRGNRLSVLPVTGAQVKIIEKLALGGED